MPQKGVRDLTKEHHWRGVLKDWQATDLNGAEYCRGHGIKYAQFKDWQKIIRRRDTEQLAAPKRGWPKGKSRERGGAQARSLSTPDKEAVGFVAAKVTDQSPVSPPTGSIEILLRCGTLLRINSLCQPGFISSVVSALESR
jgi:hypothetical protein